VPQVSGARLRGFAPGSTHQGCSGGESLATCGRFDPHQRQTSYHLRHLAGQYQICVCEIYY